MECADWMGRLGARWSGHWRGIGGQGPGRQQASTAQDGVDEHSAMTDHRVSSRDVAVARLSARDGGGRWSRRMMREMNRAESRDRCEGRLLTNGSDNKTQVPEVRAWAHKPGRRFQKLLEGITHGETRIELQLWSPHGDMASPAVQWEQVEAHTASMTCEGGWVGIRTGREPDRDPSPNVGDSRVDQHVHALKMYLLYQCKGIMGWGSLKLLQRSKDPVSSEYCGLHGLAMIPRKRK